MLVRCSIGKEPENLRKPTKCFYCPDAPMYLVTSEQSCHSECGFEGRAVCLEHVRPFVLTLTYEVEALYDIPPRTGKKKK